MASFKYFPFFYQDWLIDTMELSTEQKGAYIDLICYAWENGDKGLPNDLKLLRKMSGLKNKKLMAVLNKFYIRDGRFFNKKLEEIRKDVRHISEINSRNAKIRWAKVKKNLIEQKSMP